MTREALREVASVEPPDKAFWLVDDYWMSYVLASKFKRDLRKLCLAGLENVLIRSTEAEQVKNNLINREKLKILYP